jgi:hypothetical protein
LRKIGYTWSADAVIRHPAIAAPLSALFTKMASKREQVGAVCRGPKRGSEGDRTLPLSCADTVEVQGYLGGRIHPKPAPHTDVWL